MSDYDNTNKGAAFKPFPEMAMILQGKVDNNGINEDLVLVKTTSKDGTPRIDLYQKVGALFENDKGDNQNKPDYTGPYQDNLRIAAWRRTKDGSAYMSFELSEKTNGAAQPKEDPLVKILDGDDVPF